MAANPPPGPGGLPSEPPRPSHDTTIHTAGQTASHSGSGNQNIWVVPPRPKPGPKAVPVLLVLLLAVGAALTAAAVLRPRPPGPVLIRDVQQNQSMTTGTGPALITLEVPARHPPAALLIGLRDTSPATNCVPGSRLSAHDSAGGSLDVRKEAEEFRVTLPRGSGRVTVLATVENDDPGCRLNLSATVA
ncbi:hypothetical protein [Kitasatospora sp. NPDC018619]|uniref:hypothetical protein n=1 Tax=unclassified Kitasatospora TaxID=2633591 RepID=UPI0037B21040